MTKIRTYIDANVLIAAFRGHSSVSLKAYEVLNDPNRELIVSDPLWLETLPKPLYHHRQEEVDFYNQIFSIAVERVAWSDRLTKLAQDLAIKYGLAAMDAIHVSTAICAQADELITGEKPTKLILKVVEIQVISIQPIS